MRQGGESKAPLVSSGENPPTAYRREPTYQGMVKERDVYVPMRDGVKLCIEISVGTMPKPCAREISCAMRA